MEEGLDSGGGVVRAMRVWWSMAGEGRGCREKERRGCGTRVVGRGGDGARPGCVRERRLMREEARQGQPWVMCVGYRR